LISSPGTVLRLTALILIGVVLQLAVLSQFTIWDTNADLTPLIALSVGLLAGSISGSVAGFLTGLAVDMALVQTLGVTSLLLIGVGYLGGRYRELRDAQHALVPALAGTLITLVYAAGFSVVQFLLGVDSSVSGLVVRDILVGALLNGVIATPVFVAVRAFLRPSLVDSFRPRRRPPPIGLRIPT
jgi:rod shape-determining protein MreD